MSENSLFPGAGPSEAEASGAAGPREGKSASAFRTISEVATELAVPQHVLRFWETKFSQVKPLKRAGGRRYYRPEDVALLRRIHRLLYREGYTIRGVQKLLRESGDARAAEGEAAMPAASSAEVGAAAAASMAEAADPPPESSGSGPGASTPGAAPLSPDIRRQLHRVLEDLVAARSKLT